MSVVRVIPDRVFAADPEGWGVWECDSETGEPLVRLAGPERTRRAAEEAAEILCDAIARITGVVVDYSVTV